MATFEVDVCAGLEASGSTVHYVKPEALPLQVKAVRRVGMYIGSYHTESLQQAQSTIFLDNDGSSPFNVIAVHVVQSPMAVRQRMMAARKAFAHDESAKAIAKAQAGSRNALNPAPVLKPRIPTTSGSGAGGF